ncbi:hypothetical protein PENSPDRAFT_661636 [Peniophora sp. CONT]|nr:hypothetical protein PENSPDRAFT_661636 [Peniophora sp. CONT]
MSLRAAAAAGQNKGKGRATSIDDDDAVPTHSERTPLLADSSTSTSYASFPDAEESSLRPRRSPWRSLLISLLAILCLSFIVGLLLILLAYSYAAEASRAPPSDLLARALSLRGPDSLDVLNITHTPGGNTEIWVEVSGRVGVDAGAALGVKDDVDDNVFRSAWKGLGRWGISRLESASVGLDTIDVSSSGGVHLASIDLPPLSVPLNAAPPRGDAWLAPVRVPLRVRPTNDAQAWMDFAKECWEAGYVTARAEVPRVAVSGGGLRERSWRRLIKADRTDVALSLTHKTGSGAPLPAPRDLVTLKAFNLHPSVARNATLALDAVASLLDPVPEDCNISLTVPSLPFIVSLPTSADGSEEIEPVPLAHVSTDPFTLTHPNISLTLSGLLLPFPASASPALGALVQNYLHQLPSPVVISTPLFPRLHLEASFPGPVTKPHVLRDVKLEDMKIKPVGQKFLASGNVLARVVLPRSMNVPLDVNAVLPDVLVFDGPVPREGEEEVTLESWDWAKKHRKGHGEEEEEDDDIPPAPPLPDPLPPRAFARIRPDTFLNATSHPGTPTPEERTEPGGVGSVTLVQARIEDVPLEVLPGRQREFGDFVGKVVFGTHGALAGVRGEAAVRVRIGGLPVVPDPDDGEEGSANEGEGIVLSGLPFEGSVRVGKKT